MRHPMGRWQLVGRKCCGCGAAGVPCAAACASGLAPETLKVTIAGIVDQACSDCDQLNGVFYPVYDLNLSLPDTYYCRWRYDLPSLVCSGVYPYTTDNFARLLVTIGKDPGTPANHYINVNWQSSPSYATRMVWYKIFTASQPDCFATHELTFTNDVTQLCDASTGPATCTVELP